MLNKKDINRPSILNMLIKYPNVEILFKKVNGGTKTLHCTLMESAIPTNNHKSLGMIFTQQDNLNIIPVWDIIGGGWKSFRIENIISIEDPEEQNKKTDDGKEENKK